MSMRVMKTMSFRVGGALALGLAILAAAPGQGRAADFDVRDEAAFRQIVGEGARVEKLGGDFKFVEGPVWIGRDGGFLVFSDIPANKLMRWDAKGGVGVFRDPSFNANGNLLDGEGRLLSAEHGARAVSRTDKEGVRRPLVERAGGRQFNSPNDLAAKSDGTVWFTDPDYGLAGRAREMEANHVFRFDPATGEAKAVISDFDKPNGICFSPDEKRLYVADSGRPRHIRVFEVTPGGVSLPGKVFCAIDKGGPDGIRCDAEGRVFSSAGDGVHVFSPDGKLLGKILTPESPANLCFGGADFKTLFITARTGLYRIELKVAGDRSR